MISGKDITIDKDGSIILNGDKYPLASQAEIDAVKGDIDDIEDKLSTLVSVYQPDNESVTVTGPYTDITFTKPVEAGYTFYLIGAVAINTAGWNMSNINPVACSIRIFASNTSAVTNLVKTTWLKVKN